MNTNPCARATHWLAGGASLAAASVVLVMSSAPVLAVDCDDVRALSKAQQIYWSKKLNLSEEQKHRIWLACYGQARSRDAKDNNLANNIEPVADRQ
ncbi:MAG TPA: hypothetical protein VGH49_14965 [Xanthobacteraceae bacterium]